MKFNWVDLILSIAILGSFLRGYKVGLLESLFSAIGFVAGGLAGLTLVMHLVRNWNNGWGKFGLIFTGILVLVLAYAAGLAVSTWGVGIAEDAPSSIC